MKILRIINFCILLLIIVMLCIDECFDYRKVLGSGCRERVLIGRQVEDLFDNQPVIPDRIVIHGKINCTFLCYDGFNFLWRRYPNIFISVTNGVIVRCKLW